MAYANKTIANTLTGQSIRFLQTAKDTNGQLLDMEATFRAHSLEPAPHFHPYQAEDFQILSGELTIRVNATQRTFRQGEYLHIPANTVHSMWNQSDKPAVVSWQVKPALDTEYFFETLTGLANTGKTKPNGIPSILQLALIANRFSTVFRLAKPGRTVQKTLFTLLTPIAYLFGYRPTYADYLD